MKKPPRHKPKKKKDHPYDGQRYLLETSCLITRLYDGRVRDYFNKLGNRSLYTSNYSQYEFKVGFLRGFIDFYLLLKIEDDASTAFHKWSQKFQIRQLKVIPHLNAYIGKLFGYMELQDKEKLLDQVEAVIFHLSSNFMEGLVSSVGDFGSHELVNFTVHSSDDYQAFIEKISQYKIIALSEFWKKNIDALRMLTGSKDLFAVDTKYLGVYEKLVEIEADFARADMPSIARAIGDPVIAVDCLPRYCLISLDNFYKVLCGVLGKNADVISTK